MKKNISNRSVPTPVSMAALAGVLAVNEAPIHLDTGAGYGNGLIYAANETRFVDAYFSEPLTSYATGWRDPNNIEGTLEFVAPKVPVSPRFEFARANNAEEFMSETDDVRGIGAGFKVIEYTGEKVNSRTYNKGLTIIVDLDQVRDNPNWRTQYTGRIMRRLFRNDLRRSITLLAAAATDTAKTWDTTAGKDPDQDCATQVIAFQDAAGVNANRILYGTVAWNKRRIAHRAQNTAGGFASAGMTVDEVAQVLGLNQGLVSKERYQSAAATKSKVVGDIVLIYLAEAGQTPEDPSNIKRFVSPTEGGTDLRVFEQQLSAKLVAITVEHYSNIVVTSTLGIQKLTIS